MWSIDSMAESKESKDSNNKQRGSGGGEQTLTVGICFKHFAIINTIAWFWRRPTDEGLLPGNIVYAIF